MTEECPPLSGYEERYWGFVGEFVQSGVVNAMRPSNSQHPAQLLAMKSIQGSFILLPHAPCAAVIHQQHFNKLLVQVQAFPESDPVVANPNIVELIHDRN